MLPIVLTYRVPDPKLPQVKNPFLGGSKSGVNQGANTKDGLRLFVEQIEGDLTPGTVSLRLYVRNVGAKTVRIDPAVFFPETYLVALFFGEKGERLRWTGDDRGYDPPPSSDPVVLAPGRFYGTEETYRLEYQGRRLEVRILLDYEEYARREGVWHGALRSDRKPLRFQPAPLKSKTPSSALTRLQARRLAPS